jgi:perosamine synthetase
VPAQTHVATVHAVELVGAKPVFVDCELETGNIDVTKIEEAITSKTKGIFIVHFAGIAADMEKICDIAEKNNLIVVEDCALAVGARINGKHVGLFGDVGCYSFYPVKHMTTAEGGMLVSKHEDVVKQIAHFRAFSVDRSHSERKIAGVYDVTGVGLNYRMSEMQAALGCTQLDKMDKNLSLRKENFETLKPLLEEAHFKVLDGSVLEQNSYYCLIALLPDSIKEKRNEIVSALTARKIGCSVYYPQPVPRMTYYQTKYKADLNLFPNATIISDCSIALPVGPHLSVDDMKIIADNLLDICQKKD